MPDLLSPYLISLFLSYFSNWNESRMWRFNWKSVMRPPSLEQMKAWSKSLLPSACVIACNFTWKQYILMGYVHEGTYYMNKWFQLNKWSDVDMLILIGHTPTHWTPLTFNANNLVDLYSLEPPRLSPPSDTVGKWKHACLLISMCWSVHLMSLTAINCIIDLSEDAESILAVE